MRILPFIMLVLLLSTAVQCNSDNEAETVDRHAGRQVEPTHSLEILDEQRDRVVARVRVALAQTEQERNAGLMDVRQMPFDTGMYFLFDDEAPRSFWMANTPLSLDILFVDRNHRIVRIHTRTVPFSERQIRSELPAKYTLEVNAGFVSEHDIREGMYVRLGEPLQE
ncbi:MAG: DUF192 domain-containing protein [Balneolaceae bacterium]|nr:MAG: DUF192 domain-containing protein [Balneolaceae bacterium]